MFKKIIRKWLEIPEATPAAPTFDAPTLAITPTDEERAAVVAILGQGRGAAPKKAKPAGGGYKKHSASGECPPTANIIDPSDPDALLASMKR